MCGAAELIKLVVPSAALSGAEVAEEAVRTKCKLLQQVLHWWVLKKGCRLERYFIFSPLQDCKTLGKTKRHVHVISSIVPLAWAVTTLPASHRIPLS